MPFKKIIIKSIKIYQKYNNFNNIMKILIELKGIFIVK